MAEEGGSHEVETVFTGKDHLSATLNRIVGAGQRINHVFDHASEVLGGFASVAAVVGGAFSLEKAIESTNEYMRSIGRITTLTGLSTQHADGLLEAMEQVGIEGESAERILLGMSRKTESMEMHMNALGQQTGSTAGILRSMGVDLRKGPEAALESMSRAVQRGKLGAGELGIAFGIPRNQTIALMTMLKKGPEYLRENIKEAEKFGVTIGDLDAFKRMNDAQSDITAAWKRINLIVGSQLMPVVADLLKGGADKLKGWVEHAREFGKTLGNFLRDHYSMVVKIGKVMLANYAIQRLTGHGIGGTVFGLGAGHGGGEKGEGDSSRGPLSILPRLLGFIRGKASMTAMAGPVRGGLQGVIDKVVLLAPVLRGIVGVIGRLSIIGIVALAAYGAFKAIKDNVWGIRTFFVELWDRITTRFIAIKLALEPVFNVFSRLFGGQGKGGILGFFADQMSSVLKGLGTATEWILKTINNLINFITLFAKNPREFMKRGVMDQWAVADMMTQMQMRKAKGIREREDDVRRMREMDRSTPSTREKAPVFDFRGSRFDIKQNFSEIDPDRIAVAFANDLAGLGERKVQSSFAPLFSI